jgi:serine/threonine protein kinase
VFATHVRARLVLLTADGRVKLADLGLARNFKNTVVTAGVGTPAFMPPEAFDDRCKSFTVGLFSFIFLLELSCFDHRLRPLPFFLFRFTLNAPGSF